MIIPKSRYDWMHFRLQYFKTMSKYNSTIFKISSQLKLCRENITDANMLEKNSLHFMPQICFCSSNIMKKALQNTLN